MVVATQGHKKRFRAEGLIFLNHYIQFENPFHWGLTYNIQKEAEPQVFGSEMRY